MQKRHQVIMFAVLILLFPFYVRFFPSKNADYSKTINQNGDLILMKSNMRMSSSYFSE